MNRASLTLGLRPVHPGELLREDVPPAPGRPKAEIARLLGLSRQSLYDLIDEKQAVTASMALRIGKLTGSTAKPWMRRQQAFDLKTAERTLGAEIDRIPTPGSHSLGDFGSRSAAEEPICGVGAHPGRLRQDGGGRAQTVLRYWNWSLSSALTPELVRANRERDDSNLDGYSRPPAGGHAGLGVGLRTVGDGAVERARWQGEAL